MSNSRRVKLPDIEAIKTRIADSISVAAYSGVMVLSDEISDQDEETGLIVSLDGASTTFKTSNNNICSGVVVSVAEDFLTKYTGGVKPEIGDRVIANINKVTPLVLADKDGVTYKLLNIREEDILATIDPDTQLKA